jgi:hypothetical protein
MLTFLKDSTHFSARFNSVPSRELLLSGRNRIQGTQAEPRIE